MAKKQKVVNKNQPKKGLSPQTKRNLGNVFKSLISNQAAIDGAKEAPFWIGIIFLILSICLPIVPIIVAQQKVNGNAFISGYNYGADRGLANTTMELEENGYIFKVEGGTLSFNKDTSENSVADDIITKKDGNGNDYQVYNFRFYVTEKTGNQLQDYITYLTTISYREQSLEYYTVAHDKAGFI